MQYIDHMPQTIRTYWNEIPQNTSRQMVFASGVGFIIEVIVTSDLQKGVVVAGLSALATAIHGLVTPLFKHLTAGRQQLTWGEEMCRTMSAFIATGAIAAAFGNRTVLNDLFIDAIIQGFINLYNPARLDVNSTNSLFIYPSH